VRILMITKGKSTLGSSENLHDRVSHVVQIAVVQCCGTDAPGADRIDAEFDAQALDLGGGQA